jgi:O-antigen ligase/tetratricopeptide (TPR) repeat protein
MIHGSVQQRKETKHGTSGGGSEITVSMAAGHVATVLMALGLVVGALAYHRGLRDAYQLPKTVVLALVGVTLATALLGTRVLARRPIVLPREGVLWIPFAVVALVSTAFSQAPAQGVSALRDATMMAGWWVVGALLVTSRGRLAWVFAALGLAGLWAAVIGLLQHSGLERWRDVLDAVEGLTGPLGITLPAGQVVLPFELLPRTTDDPRSVAGHVNVAGEMVVLGLLASAALTVVLDRALRAWRVSSFVRGLAILPLASSIVVQGTFLYIAGSRAAYLAVATTIAVAATLWWRQRRAWGWGGSPVRARMLAGVVLVVGAAALLAIWVPVRGRGGREAQPLVDRLAETVDWSSGTENERIILWKNTAAMIASHPWGGVGPGNWKISYPRWSRTAASHASDKFSLARQPERTHCDPLHLVAETGFLGAGFLGLFLCLAWRRAFVPGTQTLERRACGLLVLAVFVIGCVAFPFQLPVTSACVFLLLGSAAGLMPPGSRTSAWTLAPSTGSWMLLGALGTVVVLAFHLNGRFVGDRDLRFAEYDHLAARVPVSDRSALPLTGRDLLRRSLDGLDRATARDPSSYRAELKRAQVLWELGLGDQALASLERVLELHPNLVQAMLLKAELHQRLGTPEDLAAAYRLLRTQALTIQPESPEIRFAFAQFLLAHGERVPENRAWAQQEAVEQLKIACGSGTYLPEARIVLASTWLDIGGRPEDVCSALAEAERQSARNPGLLTRCARLYADPRLEASGDPRFGPAGTKTQSLWVRIAAMRPGRTGEASLEIALVDWHRSRQGGAPIDPALLADLERRVAAFSEAHSDQPLPRVYRALMLEELGRTDEARREWGRLVRYGQGGGLSPTDRRRIHQEAAQAAARLSPGSEKPR